jgi:hypothetical protein
MLHECFLSSAEVKDGGAVPPLPDTSPWPGAYSFKQKDNFTFTCEHVLLVCLFLRAIVLVSILLSIDYSRLSLESKGSCAPLRCCVFLPTRVFIFELGCLY